MTLGSIRVHDIVPRSEIYGPGTRWVLWVQGCTLACAGCWNTETWSRRAGARCDGGLRGADKAVSRALRPGSGGGRSGVGGSPQRLEPLGMPTTTTKKVREIFLRLRLRLKA